MGPEAMRDLLFPVQHNSSVSLQTQLRRHIVDALMDGRLSPAGPLPSCRRLAQTLGVSRNTVVLTYQALADEGLLLSRERVGYFVNADLAPEPMGLEDLRREDAGFDDAPARNPVDWWHRLHLRPSRQSQIMKPKDWRRYPYAFIYGQCDPKLFPLTAWRLCSRQALSVDAVRDWSEDSFDEDDPHLIEEIRQRVLPRRGIKASAEEILITCGAQNALYLVGQLLAGPGASVGFEDPGYVDARNIFVTAGARIRPLRVDGQGLVVDDGLAGCDLVYVTPSHQSPTTVTLPAERRRELMERAAAQDIVLVEDDYDAETNFFASPTTALKSVDRDGRVIHIGSFSKYIAPGLRIGYIVAAADFIREARLLRRLILRHPPANNQRTLALFIAGGYYDALVQRLQRSYRERWEAMTAALEAHMPIEREAISSGGSSFWVRGPQALDSDALASQALERGVVIEPGSMFYMAKKPPRNCFRLGFSNIDAEKIAPGIEVLSELVAEQL
jgi:GntR family transcriptional regulator/MocR family aminotransferase